MTANLGGLITKTELLAEVVPVIYEQFRTLIDTNCGEFRFRSPPNCNCSFGSLGSNLIKTFDGGVTNGIDRDCQISTAEILQYATLDSCSKDSCTIADSISVGLRIQAVKAKFPL
jgi:hypothetical protein